MRLRYHPHGAAHDLFLNKSPEVLLSGPAGTGKSRACLEKLHLCLAKYPKTRGIIVRKTLESLKGSGIVTYTQKVQPDLDGVTYFGGSQQQPAHYRYPNGSKLMVVGLDKPGKVLSSEFDIIYAQEATELLEGDWETLTTRLRNGAMPYQQIIADCNPEGPSHWLKLRCDRGQTTMLQSRHEDNPTVTEQYLATLRALTGVRRARFYDGTWAAAEGLVYEQFDERIHVIDAAPRNLREYTAAVDWGFTNAGVINVFGKDGDGRLYRVAEHYMTGKTMQWWIPVAKALRDEFRVKTFCCDPAEPGYIKEFRDAHLPVTEGYNRIAPGIGAVQDRLAVAKDGRPRLFFVRDGLRERDEALVEAHKPFSTIHEFTGYVWPKGMDGRPVKETPVDDCNHGLDTVRYEVAMQDIANRPGRPAAPIEIERTSPW